MGHQKKKLTKPDVMYIDMDGVMVSLNKLPYPQLVPDAMDFIAWAVKHFKCKWLTCWGEEEIHKQFPQLPKIEYADWSRKLSSHGDKVTGIDLSEQWVWLDDDKMSNEQAVLEEKGQQYRFVHIDGQDNEALTKFMKWANKEWDLKD